VTPMATFREFCDGVVREMPRATGREKEDVRWELTDHLLEHRDMLVEHGYDELEAERRAIAAMGDPAEIGRAWNEKLSPFWLWAGRIAKAVCIALLVCNCTTWWYFAGNTLENLRVRTASPARLAEEFIKQDKKLGLIAAQELDIEREMGGQVVRIYRAELREPDGVWSWKNLKIYAVCYAKNPLAPSLNGDVLRWMTCNGERAFSAGGGGGGGETHRSITFQVDEDIEKVCLALDYLGNSFSVDVELDWGGVQT